MDVKRLDAYDFELAVLSYCLINPSVINSVASELEVEEGLIESPMVVQCLTRLQKLRSSLGRTPNRVEALDCVEPTMEASPERDPFLKAYEMVKTAGSNKVGEYIRSIQDRRGRRILSEISIDNIIRSTYSTAHALQQIREQVLPAETIARNVTVEGGLLADNYETNRKTMVDRMDPDQPKSYKFTTGWSALDGLVEFPRASYNIIGARPSIGKTASAINMALRFAMQGYRVKFITLEMPYAEILNLMVCCLGRIPKRHVAPAASQKTRSAVSDAMVELHGLPIELEAKCSTVGAILSSVEASLASNTPADIVFVDYFQIVKTVKRFRGDFDKLNYISEAFRTLKSDNQICVFLCAQLNRNAADRAPELKDLKGTGDLEQDADTVILLDRPNKSLYEKEQASTQMEKVTNDDQMDLHVKKNRYGRTGSVAFEWDGSTGAIVENSELTVGQYHQENGRSHDYQTPDHMQRSSGMETGQDGELPF